MKGVGIFSLQEFFFFFLGGGGGGGVHCLCNVLSMHKLLLN